MIGLIMVMKKEVEKDGEEINLIRVGRGIMQLLPNDIPTMEKCLDAKIEQVGDEEGLGEYFLEFTYDARLL